MLNGICHKMMPPPICREMQKTNKKLKQLGQGKNETLIKPDVEKCADKNLNKDHACAWAFRGFNCFKTAHLPLVQTSVKKN